MTGRVGGGFQDWAELRAHAINVFHETPNPVTEQAIIDAYEQHPDAVQKAINAIAVDVEIGTVRSGWGVLRKRAETIRQPPNNPTRSTSLDREKHIMRAEQWIRAAGIHYDREDEILLELFGNTGTLRPYAQIDLEPAPADADARWQQGTPRGDTALTQRITAHWHEHRPTGQAIEHDAQARANAYLEHQRKLTAIAAAHKAALDAKQTPADNDDDQPL